ncbi:MAG: hypothetical protein IPJ69_00160 [Deltaproteobacteria bacterium]|nr:MAG: hypothetical protein IPJ69_00160 [Deltaproteobacteria bacterium]
MKKLTLAITIMALLGMASTFTACQKKAEPEAAPAAAPEAAPAAAPEAAPAPAAEPAH